MNGSPEQPIVPGQPAGSKFFPAGLSRIPIGACYPRFWGG